ncbi:inactive protein RESTRICTED TEV MOVEMENT 1-like isoform X2 [Henckelia pumila]|uniref:inactive protein RESTRICTED TEV MOVEMENT 1-like isoform X2 n=1 Tax=Henckelia pumila TaxID=405737 RepID=UPI003C6E2706
MDDSGYIKIGAVGSKSGTAWDEKGRTKIVQIFVSHDEEINSIQFQYAENGSLVLSDSFGHNEGYKFDVVTLNYPSEYITSVSGHKSYNNGRLNSLTFGTNKGEYGPYGRSSSHDKEFSFRLGNDRQFGGFHGTADSDTVRSIGVYLKPAITLDSFRKSEKVVKADESWEMLHE